MKLISYLCQGQQRYGALKGQGIVDLGLHFPMYPDLKSLLGADPSVGLDAAASILAESPPTISLDRVQVLPPIPNPGAIWCAGMNTHSHFEEAKVHMGLKDKPVKPILFVRTASTLIASREDLEKPTLEKHFDYEGEIAVIVGRRGRNIAVRDALAHVAGYACFNDASARDYQISSPQISAGKNAFRSGGFGPHITTADEVDAASLVMTCRVNGQEMQKMHVEDLIFSFAELIAFISEFTWLEPGDVIVTGSPAGVGILRQPPVLLKAGDQIEVEVSGVGVLVNGVREQVL